MPVEMHNMSNPINTVVNPMYAKLWVYRFNDGMLALCRKAAKAALM